MAINSLGYIGVYSSDVSEWATYGTQVLGMEDVSAELDDGNVYLKMDDRPFRVVVMPAQESKFALSGWEANSAQGMADVVANLETAGVAVTQGSDEEIAARRVQDLVKFTDPAGNQHELFWGAVSDFRKLNSPVGVSGFVTGTQGLGHIVLPAPNFDETSSFFTDVLGFGMADLMKIKFTDDPNEPEKRLWFMHCNERHHSLALFEMPIPSGCVHAMFEVESIDEVGMANDRRIANNVQLSGTLGRHANDHMVSFYMKSPSNFDIEYGAGGRTIDDWDNFTAFQSTVASFWGHDFSVGQP